MGSDNHIGKEIPIDILVIARMRPMGAQRKTTSDVNGVGLQTNRPSWKIIGFKY